MIFASSIIVELNSEIIERHHEGSEADVLDSAGADDLVGGLLMAYIARDDSLN